VEMRRACPQDPVEKPLTQKVRGFSTGRCAESLSLSAKKVIKSSYKPVNRRFAGFLFSANTEKVADDFRRPS